jgi:hypothetical protein
MSGEYEITIKVLVNSTLDKQQLKNLLVVALWDEADHSFTPDGSTDELEVIDYQEITVEEV